MTPAAPDRSLTQRMEALQSANVIRTKRADLKRDIKAGRVDVRPLLLDPPDDVKTAKVFDLLLACPKHGRVKVNRLLALARISPSKTVGGLSERQRAELVRMVGRQFTPSTRKARAKGTDPDAQHMQSLRRANGCRFAVAAVKRQIAAGEKTGADILGEIPAGIESMTIFDLITAQHRWGRSRARRLLIRVNVRETKPLGELTPRQRDLLIDALAAPPVAVEVIESGTGRLHLISRDVWQTGCGQSIGVSFTHRAAAAWHDDDAERCQMCVLSAAKRNWTVDGR